MAKANGGSAIAAVPDSAIDPFNGNVDLSQLDYSQLLDMLDSGEAVHIGELDDTSVVEKADLVGVPMVITAWRQKASDMGEYVIVNAATPNGKVVFADGSTGIKEQLIKFDVVGKPIVVPKGLRRSDYTYKDDEGKAIPATTYYLDNGN
jgi:hypothetical protein